MTIKNCTQKEMLHSFMFLAKMVEKDLLDAKTV